MSSRRFTHLALPVAAATLAVAVPALAGGRAHAASNCFTATVGKHHVRECLLPGPRGPRGFTGATGRTGPRGPRGPAGLPGSARAYAVVNPALVGSTPSSAGLVPALTSGFTAVRSPSTGVYCLTPASGVNPAAEPATVSGESSLSTSGVVPLAVLDAGQAACSPQEFEVRTFDAQKALLPAATAAFAIVAP